MHTVARFLGATLAVLLAAHSVPGFHVDGYYTAALVAVVLGALNITIRPLISLLTLPLTVLSLGLFTFFINAILMYLASSIVPGFTVDGFVPALIGGAVVAIVGWALHKLI